VHAAARAARDGVFVAFGVRPDRPETGYGYLELGDGAGPAPLRPFRRFVEKPDAASAAAMVAAGGFLWNAGLFCLPVAGLRAAFERLAPDIVRAVRPAVAEAARDLDFLRLGPGFAAAPDISLDYAIMERMGGGLVAPLDCGWNDLGSWRTVWSESRRDAQGVAAGAATTAIDCRDTLLRSEDGQVELVGIGLDGIAAIAMRDAVLVARLDRAQDVREAVAALKLKGAAQAESFPRVHRPWGWFETLVAGERFLVKRIVVRPGRRLSLQSHLHRSEHWVVVTGTAQVTLGDEVRLLSENQSAYIPLGQHHRLENPGRLDLHLIEVASGAYLGEDDITRWPD
jgi:mannose-1-phosphate guanylyltransferase/mannose-1-phosphate guanylyltransferase/mannose-6-phosphate isomerase